ncbi:restriction endonuclease subunit S [Catenibacterium mitsuokai]|uniref:restriction endonuclease subunit S n=1 Tax=Catenibacterium mitsuokai TaxID=100886 RepID=UPI00242C552A|nr:restriction endonuclease subunit S [Catenibacterium mitsuokai]MDD6595468.1 restriction endonuclease subunit S [Catenibacterium mitsuokai]
MEYKKLGDIATYINGYAFKPEQRGSEGLPIIRIQDLTGNAYDLGYYNGDYPKKVELNDGDVLISWSASLGVYLWNRGKALLNQHIFKVVFDKVEIDKFYFMYAVEYNLDRMSLKTHGATMKHITKKDFDNVVIPYLDLDYQKEVAYRLTSLKGIIEKYQKQLDLLDELVKARFVEMFGDPITNDMLWNTVKLNDVCYGIGDGLHGTPEYDEYGDYPFINGNNLKNGMIEITPSTKMVNEDIYRKYFIKLTENTILLSINGTLGNLALYNGEKVVLGKSACYCNLIPDIIRIFVCSVMKTDAFSNFLESNATSSTIKNIGLKVIREFELIVPPLELQNQFASFVQEIDKSRLRELLAIKRIKLLLNDFGLLFY